MPKRKATRQLARLEARDADAVDYGSIDWAAMKPLHLDLDPALIERLRARQALKQLTLRVGVEQIAEARRVAAKTGRKYQAVLRQWLAEGASVARAERLGSRRRPQRSAE